jgi:hypothetical protein
MVDSCSSGADLGLDLKILGFHCFTSKLQTRGSDPPRADTNEDRAITGTGQEKSLEGTPKPTTFTSRKETPEQMLGSRAAGRQSPQMGAGKEVWSCAS